MSSIDDIVLEGDGAKRAAEILVRRGAATMKHASPGCACGTNAAGEEFVDPICRSLQEPPIHQPPELDPHVHQIIKTAILDTAPRSVLTPEPGVLASVFATAIMSSLMGAGYVILPSSEGQHVLDK